MTMLKVMVYWTCLDKGRHSIIPSLFFDWPFPLLQAMMPITSTKAINNSLFTIDVSRLTIDLLSLKLQQAQRFKIDRLRCLLQLKSGKNNFSNTIMFYDFHLCWIITAGFKFCRLWNVPFKWLGVLQKIKGDHGFIKNNPVVIRTKE